jgi:hypothetical protein
MKILLAVLLLIAVVYGLDDVIARIRHKPGADIQITRFLAVPQKFNKIEYDPADPVVERCFYTLFPHFGGLPCWYLRRHTVRFIELG